MSAEEGVAIYRRFVAEVLNKGNVDAADQFFAPTLTDHSLPPDVPGTLDGFKEWFTMFHNAFPDGKWTIDFITGTGDIVAHHNSMVGTHKGEYLGVATSGKQVTTQETGITASGERHTASQQAARADRANAPQFRRSLSIRNVLVEGAAAQPRAVRRADRV